MPASAFNLAAAWACYEFTGISVHEPYDGGWKDRRRGKPMRGIWAYKDDRTRVPGVSTVVWNDTNIRSCIDSL
jgi:hypothetical protein